MSFFCQLQCKFCCYIDRCDSWHPHTFHTLCVTSWQVLRNTRKFVVFDVVRYTSCQSLDKWVSSGHSWKTDFFSCFKILMKCIDMQCNFNVLGMFYLFQYLAHNSYLHVYTFPPEFKFLKTFLHVCTKFGIFFLLRV